MARKTFVLDTNVLLHDPHAIEKFTHSDVVLPLSLLEELDERKKLAEEIGKNARQVLRYIDALKETHPGNFHEGVVLENGVRLRIELEKEEGRVEGFPLPLSQKKNRILFVAYQISKRKQPVVFVSKDFVMRMKAEAIGLEAQDYANLKASYEDLYQGYRKIEVPKKEIDLFYKDGFLKLDVEGFYPNEYCLLVSPEKSSAACKYNFAKGHLESLISLKRDIWGIYPLNLEQRCALDLLLRDDVKLVTLVGQAGTGKTLLALAAALRKVLDENLYNRILVSRPIIPLGKDIGYLPGSKEEKLYHWMQPIYDNLDFLCQSSSGDSSEMGGDQKGNETKRWLLESQKIEMEAVAYIRGRTLPKMFMIIDEAQNLTPHEVKTIISRAGQGTKVVLTGDPTQIDNPYLDKDSNALTYTIGKLKQSPLFGHILLERTERSELAALAASVL